MKQWVKPERETAKQNGDRPVYYSGLSDSKRMALHQEGHHWYRLASGTMLEQCVPPRPTSVQVAAVRDHIARCCEHLHAAARARGDLLPEGLWSQLETAERRIAMALDIVDNAPAEWSREADAAWQELTKWARNLDMERPPLRRNPWESEEWRSYING
ncbi:hypothetical protein [Streptomyces sp. NRRL S-920]|uniref:hypothetical protein n=1 Tax=Streptomyces sp. NRRL S-920 TaxID=1463921 RepID=UPI00131C5643|nr:hypothetical protein [Streptomyces sp. NRRL S-920]